MINETPPDSTPGGPLCYVDNTRAPRARSTSAGLRRMLFRHLSADSGSHPQRVVEKLRGPVNTTIRLKIIRSGNDATIDIAVVRDNIRVGSVRGKVEDDVGVVRISQFNEQTSDGLKKAIQDITNEVPKDKLLGYVIDLRNNPGGLLDQAISVSDAFLERGEIVSTHGRAPEETKQFNAHPGDLTNGKPVIVLINKSSAAASEIVAGALQDNHRAALVGTRSFGRGSIQTIIPLGPGNGALRLTTEHFFTPSGRSIEGMGISPDIEVVQDQSGDDKPLAKALSLLRNNPVRSTGR
jgi:carboxyl-terminal processing protease